MRREPDYPVTRKTGRVELELTISETGAVETATVVHSEPEGVFDRAAVRAVEQWRYRPSVRDGTPIQQTGVRVELEFSEDDRERAASRRRARLAGSGPSGASLYQGF